MNTQFALVSEKTLRKLDVKALWETNLSDLKAQLETVANPSQKVKIRKAIANAEFRVTEIEYMETLAVGQWVSSNLATKPGEVVSLGYAGRVPEVMVKWWGASVAVPERPLNLSVLTGDDLSYQWNHDKFPKLVRRFDGTDCGDVEILQQKLEEASLYLTKAIASGESDQDWNLKITYCKKRIAYLSAGTRERILISRINRDGGTQQRVSVNHELVKEYAEAMGDGDKFPPVKLTYDGANYWLTDGFHTTEAAWSIGEKDIEAIVTKGSQRDAILASVSVNSDHGLRRSNADKRRAVMTLLEDQEWGQWSDREISRRCKVDHKTVGKIRQELTGEFPSDNPRKYKDKYGNESEMNLPEVESCVAVRNNCSDKQDNLMISSTDKLSVGQIVRIKSDRSDKRLVGYNLRVAVITQVNPASVDLKTWGQSITNVSPNDLEVLDQDNLPPVSFAASANYYRQALVKFDSPEDMLAAAIHFKQWL